MCKLNQGISADFERGEKRLAAGVEILAAQRFTWRISDAVNQKIETSKFFADSFEGRVNLFLFANVTWQQQRTRYRFVRQILDVFFKPIALISEGEARARLRLLVMSARHIAWTIGRIVPPLYWPPTNSQLASRYLSQAVCASLSCNFSSSSSSETSCR